MWYLLDSLRWLLCANSEFLKRKGQIIRGCETYHPPPTSRGEKHLPCFLVTPSSRGRGCIEPSKIRPTRAPSGSSTFPPRPPLQPQGLLMRAPDWMGEEVGLQREGGGAQRYLVALPGCSIRRTWHSPWGEGEWFGFLLPAQSLRACCRAAGRTHAGTDALSWWHLSRWKWPRSGQHPSCLPLRTRVEQGLC